MERRVRRRSTGWRRSLGLAAVAAVLVGLFAMHALGLHGTSVPEPATTVTAFEHAGASAAADRETAPNHDHGQSSHPCPECTDSHLEMAGMCLSILLAVAISVLRLRPRLFLRWALEPWRRLDARILAVAAARPPRPPSLHVLCISRT